MSGSGAAIRPFGRSLPMQLMRARELVMKRFRPHLHAHGLTDQQWRIIRALAETDSLEVLEISERCCIHAASLSRILPKLEKEGIIARRANSEDQRRVIVSLTQRGQRLFRRIAPESERIYAALASEIGIERLDDVYRLLDETISALIEPHAGRRGTARLPRARAEASDRD
ncbi:MAG TPA: homoprotocatechuate degradation operon regulator HpaR [Candidatus Cybelea sp.]|nr:homoprotocatechuate degradation operon regulator HpaR [Candidatus Cybelea sp.]